MKQSEKKYSVNKEIRMKTSMLRSHLCDFSDAYFVVEGIVTVAKKTFVANDFMDLAETRRAASAPTSNNF